MTRLSRMSVVALLASSVFLCSVVHADEPPKQPRTQTSQNDVASPAEPLPDEVKRCEVLELAPADAWLIAYTAKGEQALRHPVIEQATGGRSGSSILARALAATFDGPTMVAVRGTPANPLSWRMVLAAKISLDQTAFFDRLGTSLVPAWNRSPLGQNGGKLGFTDDGERGYLTLPSPVAVSLTLIVREGVVYGFSGLEPVEEQLEQLGAGESFVNTGEFERLDANRGGPIGTFIYADLRTLVPLLAPQLNQLVPRLFEAIQLDSIECAALIASGPLRPGPLRLAVGVSGVERGLWRLLASTPSRADLAKAFPQDVTYFVQSSYQRASDIMDDLMAFGAVIDREIVDEYTQERLEFKREVGLDPHTDILANFVEGWAIGGRVEYDHVADQLVVFRLGSAEKFRAHLHALRIRFQLESATSHYRSVAISQAQRSLGPFFYAVVNNLLLVTGEEPAMHRAIDATLDRNGLDRLDRFHTVRRLVSPAVSKFLYFNLGDLFARAIESGEEFPIPGLEAIAEAGTSVGLALSQHENMIALDLVSSDGTSEAFSNALFLSVSASLARARDQSARLISASNVKGLLISCKIYANDHKHQWPPNLKVLVQDGSILPRMLNSPYDHDKGHAPGSYYLYRPIEDESAVKTPGNQVVISEPAIHGGGAVFGFADGHARWVESPEADELMAIMRSGR